MDNHEPGGGGLSHITGKALAQNGADNIDGNLICCTRLCVIHGHFRRSFWSCSRSAAFLWPAREEDFLSVGGIHYRQVCCFGETFSGEEHDSA
jgi:hypothetical protein